MATGKSLVNYIFSKASICNCQMDNSYTNLREMEKGIERKQTIHRKSCNIMYLLKLPKYGACSWNCGND